MRRVLAAVAIALVLHEVLIRVLDRIGLIEQLLAPDLGALVALAGAALLFVVRLGLMWVAPLVVALALARELVRRSSARSSIRTGSS